MNGIKGLRGVTRREFLRLAAAGVCSSVFHPFSSNAKAASPRTHPLFWIKDIPEQLRGNTHVGVDHLFNLMGSRGLKLYRSSQKSTLSGPSGMIQAGDVVLIKVNAQWKYRGCTNSDLIRGLVQKILDHPDGFQGEVVIFENGQGRGSLNCDTSPTYPDALVHANAEDESHSFLYLVDTVFNDVRVSSYLLDPIRSTFISQDDHVTDGYRIYENVSYPCFTTAGGHRVELREGVWQEGEYSQNLKLINVPVLKHHDEGGSEITASLKHFYGILSMADGQADSRHYSDLGNTCGKMVVSVRTPILNIIDAIWVSHASLTGYPESTTRRVNQILASQDPVALDYWSAKYVLYPIDNNDRHEPSFVGIDQWLSDACNTINARGGLYNADAGIVVNGVTKNENEIQVHTKSITVALMEPWGGEIIPSGSTYTIRWESAPPSEKFRLLYSIDNGATWRAITSGFVTGTSYDWTVPKPRGNRKKCALKLIAYDANNERVGADRAGDPFTIEVVQLTSPNGGEPSLKSGDPLTIAWRIHETVRPITKVRLLYTKNGGYTWSFITALSGSFPPGDHSYSWTIPPVGKTSRTRCRVKVELKNAREVTEASDVSDDYFTISALTMQTSPV